MGSPRQIKILRKEVFYLSSFRWKYGESKGELFAASKKERPMLWSFVLEWTTTSDCRANFRQKLACRSDGADSPWGQPRSIKKSALCGFFRVQIRKFLFFFYSNIFLSSPRSSCGYRLWRIGIMLLPNDLASSVIAFALLFFAISGSVSPSLFIMRIKFS